MRSRLVLSLGLLLLAAACAREEPEAAKEPAQAARPRLTQLERIDLVKGTGEGISQGQTAVVHYTGWLYDASAPEFKGRKFDSSRDSGQPFRFTLGQGGVIRGWEEGVQGMQVGGQRRLLIPSELGYGERGTPGGPIPPNAALVFDIELLAIE
ncbi:MAG TPA: FKBP-type peptidyl-prolyl cis-trans isomerase [Steroidobacter sp.]